MIEIRVTVEAGESLRNIISALGTTVRPALGAKAPEAIQQAAQKPAAKKAPDIKPEEKKPAEAGAVTAAATTGPGHEIRSTDAVGSTAGAAATAVESIKKVPSLEEIKAFCSKRHAEDHVNITEILKKHGAARLSELAEDDLGAFYEDVKAA